MNYLPIGKKSLGQHWLSDAASLQAMCDGAELDGQDVVLEIGPGLGTLTELLVKRAKQVMAVEVDESLANRLSSLQFAKNLQIFRQDILQFDFSEMPPNYKVVANIPYYLTSNLIRVLSETPNPPQLAVLLVQKEVAERVAAEPGEMSILSLTAQFYWEVNLGRVVSAKMFTPPPKVDSQILILKRREELLFPDVNTKKFFRLVKAGFSAKRKTLENSLSGGLKLGKDETKILIQETGINPRSRPQELSLNDWYKIYKTMLDVLSMKE